MKQAPRLSLLPWFRDFHLWVIGSIPLLLRLGRGWGLGMAILLLIGLVLLTTPLVHSDGVTPTNTWVDMFSRSSQWDGQPVPVGAEITVFDPQNVACGQFIVQVAGQFGIMPCYGDDPLTPQDEGAQSGDVLHFAINGQPAQVVAVSLNRTPMPSNAPIIWHQHGDLWEVQLIGPILPTPTPTPLPTSTPTPTPTWTPTPTPQRMWRFEGFTLQGQPNAVQAAQPHVTLRLYARGPGGYPPGQLVDTQVSGNGGYFCFDVIEAFMQARMRLVMEVPAGVQAVAAWSPDGLILSPTEIEWIYPSPTVHPIRFYLRPQTPTPTPTWTPLPTATFTPTPTATRITYPTSTPTSTSTPTPTPHHLYLPRIWR